ncbi:MAG: phytanoyl-CoA dioxygenase family protein [Gammaproteobacteria bacterium]
MNEHYGIAKAPDGSEIKVPASVADDTGTSFSADQLSEARCYYDDNGYVVIRNLVPQTMCDEVSKAFLKEVKPYKGFLYRQSSSGVAEKHHFSVQGHMLNPIMNVQDLRDSDFKTFKDKSLACCTYESVKSVSEALLGELPKIVQTMYFEGNPVTWAHQDTYYLDAEEIGGMLAMWLAIEGIQPGAGRFYVYPRSHKMDISEHSPQIDIAYNHKRYKQLILDVIAKAKLECRAPALAAGDALFWNSKTVHGSLDTTQRDCSRSSLTAQMIPESQRLLQFQNRIKPLNVRRTNGVQIHYPKDQAKLHNRVVFFVESNFPRGFYAVKRLAIRSVVWWHNRASPRV